MIFLFSDSQGFIYFNELLFCVLRKVYRPQIEADKNDLAMKEIHKIEENTRLKLHLKKKTRV